MTNNFKLIQELIEKIKKISKEDLDEAIRMINEKDKRYSNVK